jgi:Na+-translocating ferredoxin:NAD+ oxidoreductase RnfC subunit
MITIEDIQNKGVVGAGGAGFPTHVKLQAKPEILIMNAAECEPLLHKDKELLHHFTDEVLEGFQIALTLTGASRGIIGIKKKHHSLISILQQKISKNMEVIPIGDFYPAGDEITLIYLTTGRIVEPGQLPITAGCVVQNVETLMNLSSPEPVTEKYLTIAGAVRQPLTLKVPIGTSYREVLSRFNVTARDARIRSGGLMMGVLETDLNAVVTKTTGGLIVLPSDHACVQIYERYLTPAQTDRMAKAACDQCSFCTELCPRYLLGYPVRPEMAMRNRMFTQPDGILHHNGNAYCCECNLCTLFSCPEGLDPKGATCIEKRMKHASPWQGLPVKPHPMMNFRKVPTEKLKQRLDVMKYRDEAPFDSSAIEPEQVRIPLKQHIGNPAVSTVEINQHIKRNALIGRADTGISTSIHASIDGLVIEVNEKEIIIQRQK